MIYKKKVLKINYWLAPYKNTPIKSNLTIPGSKSITNRILILASLAKICSLSRIFGALQSRDTALMIDAMRTLGIKIDISRYDKTELTLNKQFESVHTEIYVNCGLAGTVMRFLPPLVAALSNQYSEIFFYGDKQAISRPITPLLDGLRCIGVDIIGEKLPFLIKGSNKIIGGIIKIDSSLSSQFISGLLLTGSSFRNGLTIILNNNSIPSHSYISMTTTMLSDVGIDVDSTNPNCWIIQPSTPIASKIWLVEPDIPNSLPFLAAAIVTGGTVRVNKWFTNVNQPISGIFQLLNAVNASIKYSNSYLEIKAKRKYKGFDIDLQGYGEIAPIAAAIAALAIYGTTSRIRGVAHLRGHETNRLAALTFNINNLGGNCMETADGLIINSKHLHSGKWYSYFDHRIATAGVVIGLRIPKVSIKNIETIGKTIPDFKFIWEKFLIGNILY